MIGSMKMAMALLLGFALTGAIGAGIALSAGQGDAPETQGDLNANDPGMLGTPPSTEDVFTVSQPEELLSTEAFEIEPEPDGGGPIAIGLAARWGYLGNPVMAGLRGHWELDDSDSGSFRGEWHALGMRLHGALWGGFTVAPDSGHGRFNGRWAFDGGRDGGTLAGTWKKHDTRPIGSFEGRWMFKDGRPGGALRGFWHADDRDSGRFNGLAIKAPTMDMVPWDGFVKVDEGRALLLREVRFEHGGDYAHGGDDRILPDRDPKVVAWRSSTTVHWDGVILGLLVPGRDTGVVFRTEQWSRTFTAGELVGLHIKVPVDRLGHEIELRGFLLPRPRPICDSDHVKVTLDLRWGNLERPSIDDAMTVEIEDEAFTPWNGFVQATKGAVGVRMVHDWERGGDYEDGEDDFVYPRDNRLTVEWRSSVTDDWDGLTVVICLPTRGGPMPHVTIHTDQWTHVYSLRELDGLHETYDIPRIGQSIEVRATVR